VKQLTPDRLIVASAAAVALAFAVAATPATADPRATQARPAAGDFQTTRTFHLDAGHAIRTFTFRERGGVILLNRITVPGGVRLVVVARIPGLAGARVVSWSRRNDPSLSCRTRRGSVVCTQGEEWCPMPAAVWHFRLVKLSGPAGAIRFDYKVAPPPPGG
jgi:hypothetical protein